MRLGVGTSAHEPAPRDTQRRAAARQLVDPPAGKSGGTTGLLWQQDQDFARNKVGETAMPAACTNENHLLRPRWPRGARKALVPVLIALVASRPSRSAQSPFQPSDQPGCARRRQCRAAVAQTDATALTDEEERYIRALWAIHGDVERSSCA